jgi:ornithine cyclodeaminase/alanine dehydrogenase-like protein (mu-crystallin family)
MTAHRDTGTALVVILTRSDIDQLLDPTACIAAVEAAFRMLANGAMRSAILGLHVADGGFHAKAAAMPGKRPYFAAKVNANFPGNPLRHGLPTIQGVLALFDAATGEPLALMDSIAITILRTAAATAIAARHLARADAGTMTIVGCGAQALAQIVAVRTVRPVARVFALDIDTARRDAFARAATDILGIPVLAAEDLSRATLASDIIVTCTTSRRAFLGPEHVSPGAFVAAVGADNAEKQEIDPRLLAVSALVVDSLEQCASIGDLHHAIATGAMSATDIRAELGDVVADPTRARRREEEIVIFDSTGVAVQDVAAAALVYERAVSRGLGIRVTLGS